MKYTKQFLFGAAAIFLFTLYTTAQKPSGKLTLAKGQQLQVESTVKTVVSMDMMGQPMEMTADADMVRSIDVKEKKETGFLISSTLTKIKSSVNAIGMSEKFDSETNEGAETNTGKMMKDALNVPKEVELDNEAKLLTAKPGNDASNNNGGMMDMMQGIISGADGAGTADAFLIIPAGKKPGGNWSDSVVMEGIKIYHSYTLKEVNGDKATVTVDGNQITNKTADQMGMEVTVTADSKISGEIVVDITTGVIEQKTLSMDGKGTAEMMGQTIPMTTKLTSSAIVKKK